MQERRVSVREYRNVVVIELFVEVAREGIIFRLWDGLFQQPIKIYDVLLQFAHASTGGKVEDGRQHTVF